MKYLKLGLLSGLFFVLCYFVVKSRMEHYYTKGCITGALVVLESQSIPYDADQLKEYCENLSKTL